MELISGEAGVLRTALGVVLGMVGIDARVRLHLWSGGVEDVTLPVVDARKLPPGAQVVVLFLSDRPQSGMVLGTLEGNLSWRRTEAPAFAEQLQPVLPETIAGGSAFFGGVLLPDERVLFVPYDVTAAMVYDPHTDTAITVEGPFAGMAYAGGVLLPDGRVVFCPRKARDLVVWDPGCGGGFGRDAALSAFWNKL